MGFLRSALLAALPLVFASSSYAAEEAAKEQVKELKVLAIGNSFSANASRYLADIAGSGGSKLVFGHAMIGGCPIEKHLNLAKKFEANPEDPEGKPYKKGEKALSLKDLLTAENWDVVTIQQFSGYSYKPETYRPYAKELCEYVKKYAPQAEIAVHETWAYRADNANTFKDGFTPVDMYQGIVKSYYGIAKELGVKRVLPVGDAFQLVNETPGQTFEIDKSFDPKTAVKPALPKQNPTLNIGWVWDAKTGKLRYDHGHANVRGEYLGGLVWYEKLFNGDARKTTFKPEKISEEDAAFLRSIAHAVVSEGKRPKAFPSID